jgi:uncharacterized RDD family membrane protein YckC
MTNPYAPPRAAVRDIADPHAQAVPADRGTRLGASILDSLIFVGVAVLPFIVAALLGAGASANDKVGATVVVGALLALVGFGVWCWLTITYMSRNGQSIAKKLLGIKVVRSDGSAVSLGRLIALRNVVNWMLRIIPFYGLLDALFIFGESRQCLHDKIADTIVIVA